MDKHFDSVQYFIKVDRVMNTYKDFSLDEKRKYKNRKTSVNGPPD